MDTSADTAVLFDHFPCSAKPKSSAGLISGSKNAGRSTRDIDGFFCTKTGTTQREPFPFAFVVLSDHYLARGLTLELAAVKHIDCDRADIISSNAVGDLIVLDVEREFTAV